jgi:TctA family transporter
MRGTVPAAPLVLATILGPQLEASLRRSLIYSHGDLLVFFERRIAATLMVLALLMLLLPLFRIVLSRKFWQIVGSAHESEEAGDKSDVSSK